MNEETNLQEGQESSIKELKRFFQENPSAIVHAKNTESFIISVLSNDKHHTQRTIPILICEPEEREFYGHLLQPMAESPVFVVEKNLEEKKSSSIIWNGYPGRLKISEILFPENKNETAESVPMMADENPSTGDPV